MLLGANYLGLSVKLLRPHQGQGVLFAFFCFYCFCLRYPSTPDLDASRRGKKKGLRSSSDKNAFQGQTRSGEEGEEKSLTL